MSDSPFDMPEMEWVETDDPGPVVCMGLAILVPLLFTLYVVVLAF